MDDPDVLCRRTDPFNPKCIAAVLDLVEIGPDLTPKQRSQIQALLQEYVDVFALSVMEVTPVKGAVHTLRIPEGKTFSTKIHQRPLNASQRDYFYPRIDEMERAGVIRKIKPEDV
ncbi:hypothetical protein FIBSPDRAFT_764331 [Athelia psychrophila]|uniref:Uncharacterized protein n=1 Tax=Athelia psychrophila TaxID=1759441 RepID=A0A167WV47_9AGAM|nr:hypothetical protein FIBSPDRAFT_764331 [Fibularhizoctonia sp. CBS 109695]